MMTDPIADMLTRIRNAVLMRQGQVTFPHSHFKEAIVKILRQEGFFKGYEVLAPPPVSGLKARSAGGTGGGVGEKTKKALVIQLKYSQDGKPAITTLRKLSRPGRRTFCGYENLKPFRLGLGVRVLTTPQGILSDQDARKKKVGGEVLMEVW